MSGARSTQTVSTTSSLRCGRRSRRATSLIAERPSLTIRVTTAEAIDGRRRAPQPHWPPTGTTEPDHRGRRRTGGDVLRLIKRPACDSWCVGRYHDGRLDSNATRVDWPARDRPGRFPAQHRRSGIARPIPLGDLAPRRPWAKPARSRRQCLAVSMKDCSARPGDRQATSRSLREAGA